MNRRRDARPGPGARLCSCHFREGKKENGPELFAHNVGRAFEPHHLTPEKKKRRTTSKVNISCSQHQDEASTSKQNLFDPQAAIEAQVENVPSEPTPTLEGSLPSAAAIHIQTPSTSTSPFVSLATLEAEIYLLKMQLERKDEIIKTLKLHFSYHNICDRDDLVLLYTGIPTANTYSSYKNTQYMDRILLGQAVVKACGLLEHYRL
ncbi:hypothetical protein FQR65_LT16338 [Abscondita terminalis]|nr:hypothetical protein FQR65_LT16338 [Abscondita terminalis]